MLTVIKDLRFALRIFAKSPWTTVVAVLSLALAIGPNAALFSVLDSLVLKPSGERYARALDLRVLAAGVARASAPSYPDLLDYQSQAHDVATFVGVVRTEAVLRSSTGRQRIPVRRVTENYFSALGAPAAAGRTLQQSDVKLDGIPPVVISYSLWQRQFGGTADALGHVLFLDGQAFSVVGIMPRGFREPGLEIMPSDAWTPLSAISPDARRELMQRGRWPISSMVILRDGVEKARAEAALTAVAQRLARQYPATNKGTRVRLDSTDRSALAGIVLALVGLVLLVACANVAGILMTQGEARRRELCVRLAIGASRSRLVRQLLLESLLLALMATALGVLMAFGLLRVVPAIQPFTMDAVNFDFHMDLRVLVYMLSLAVVAALTAGLVPALRVSRRDLVSGLKGDAPPPTGRRLRFRGALVIAQIAFSQFLLVEAGLLVRSYLEVQRVHPGFDPNRSVLVAMVAPETDDAPIDYVRLADRLRAVPGVRRISSVRSMPLSGSGASISRVVVPGKTSEPMNVNSTTVSPGYFAIMGTQVLRGRDFDSRDPIGTFVVNEVMARQVWGGPEAAVGKVFRIGETNCHVIGVVEDGKYFDLNESPKPFLFTSVPLGEADGGTLLIETTPGVNTMLEAVRKVIRDAEPNAVVSLTTLSQHMALPLFPFRMATGLVGALAILGVFLAGVGLHGLVSYSVVQRTHEIGVRVALGANPRDVLRLVGSQVMSRIAIGALIGIAAAWAAAQITAELLYGISPADPIGIAAGVVMVAVVALLAAYAPAYRAVRISPMSALREQ